MKLFLPSKILLILVLVYIVTQAYGCLPGQPAAKNEDKLEIPFALIRNRIIVPVRIKDSREFKVILDTGMHFDGLLLYNKALRDSIALDDPIDVEVPGAGGDEPSTAIMADSMSFFVGQVECQDQMIIILQNERMAGMPTEGVTGYSLFGHYTVEADYDRMVLVLHDTATLKVDSSWSSVDMTFKNNRIPWIEGMLNINGGGDVPISMYIDLASAETIEILVSNAMKVPLPADLEDVLIGTGLSGDIYGQKGTVASIKIGPYYIKNVEAAFAQGEILSKQDNADAVLGNNALRRFNVIFDYHNSKLYLKPNKYFQKSK